MYVHRSASARTNERNETKRSLIKQNSIIFSLTWAWCRLKVKEDEWCAYVASRFILIVIHLMPIRCSIWAYLRVCKHTAHTNTRRIRLLCTNIVHFFIFVDMSLRLISKSYTFSFVLSVLWQRPFFCAIYSIARIYLLAFV